MEDYTQINEELPDDTIVPDYPTAQWYNKRLSAFDRKGGLFIPSGQLLEGMQLPGWTPTSAEFDEKTDSGLGTLRAELAAIRTRFRWKVGEGFASRNGVRPEPGSGIRGNLQLLCAVKGCDSPLVLTFSGLASQLMENFIRDFAQKVVGEANKTARTRLPKYAFWMTIEAGTSTKGGKTKQSTITPPVMVLPPAIDRAYLTGCYVGTGSLQQFAHWYRAAETWATYWDTLYTTPQGAAPPVEAEEEAA